MNEPANPIQVYVNTIKGPEMQDIILKSLPKEVNVDKFTAAVVSALRNSPQLFVDCDRTSLYNAIVEAARRGLVPDGKQGALLPFNTKVSSNPDKWVKKAQFMIMPQGIIDSLAKVGISVYAQSVYEKDTVRFWSDDHGQHVDFEYHPFEDRGQRVGAFAAASTKDGKTYVETVNIDYIERIKAVSKQKDKQGNMTGPWRDWPEKMEQKSALHLICKRLPTVDIGDDDEYKEVVRVAEPPVEGRAEAAQEAPQEPTRTVPESGNVRPKALQKLVDTADEVLDAPYTQSEGVRVEGNSDGAPF